MWALLSEESVEIFNDNTSSYKYFAIKTTKLQTDQFMFYNQMFGMIYLLIYGYMDFLK